MLASFPYFNKQFSITLSSVVVSSGEGHLGDNSGITLVADLNLDFSTGLVETLLDVTHSHALLQSGRESTGGDLTDLLTIGEHLSTVTSGSTGEGEAHALLGAALHL